MQLQRKCKKISGKTTKTHTATLPLTCPLFGGIVVMCVSLSLSINFFFSFEKKKKKSFLSETEKSELEKKWQETVL